MQPRTPELNLPVYEGETSISLRPRQEIAPLDKLTVALEDVRAVDPIRISYDFPRNGWKIEQQLQEPEDDTEESWQASWVEVANIPG